MIKRAIITFSICISTALSIGLYLRYSPSPAKRLLNRFSSSKIEKTCLKSPEQFSYTLCLQRKLSTIYQEARPFDILAINNVINEVYNKDRDSNKDSAIFYKTINDYAYSYTISIDHLRNFNIYRGHFSYFQIIFKPLINTLIISHLTEVLEYLTTQTNKFKQVALKKQYRENLNRLSQFVTSRKL